MKPLHVLLLFLVVFVWGANFVFVQIGLEELPPLFFCFARFFLLSVPAICFFKRPTVPFKWVLLYGLVMFVLQFALMFSGMKAGVSAGLASILLQTQVFFSIFFASLLLKETVNRWQIFGALLSFSGIVLIGFYLGTSTTFLGLLLFLAAAATWGFGSTLVKKMGKTHSGSLLVWSSFVAWPVLLLLSLLFEEGHSILFSIHRLSLASYIAVFFTVLGSTAIGFGIWNWLLQIYPIAMVAPFTLLIPIVGTLSSILFLNEPLESWKILSGILVVGGLCFHFLGSRFVSKQVVK